MKPLASLSLDLDNHWSYLKTHGDPGWQTFPSYLDKLVPPALDLLARRKLTITFFVVGQDAALDHNRDALAALARAGHEIGNHSFRHEPWLHLYSPPELAEELARAEESIERATGRRPLGFRGPGYSVTPAVLDLLAARGYCYDASTLPTFIGPLARAFYFRTCRLTAEQRRERANLFGGFRDGLRPLAPYRWGPLLEIPVSTFPGLRTPIHFSYLLYLSRFSAALAQAYLVSALRLFRLFGSGPSLLLHSLDFLSAADAPGLSFFPAMDLPAERKIELLDGFLDTLTRHFTVVPLQEHARHL